MSRPNYGKIGKGPRLEAGMTLAIEPMVIQGNPNILELDDGWTIITEDVPSGHLAKGNPAVYTALPERLVNKQDWD